MAKKFQRRIEDFVCEHCGAKVTGNGYTNHCPQCLWSKHVDVSPGDRAEMCAGMMKPIAIEGTTPHYKVVQKCEKCGYIHRNVLADNDNPETIVTIATPQ